jgi:hypothetical protein
MSEFRRIVIDSRYRTADSSSNADFYVELPYMVNVPAGSLAYIDNISLSHSWPTIQENVNDKLYVQEWPNGMASGTLDRVVQLAPGSYNAQTLQVEVQTKLNSGSNITTGTYVVSLSDGVFTIGHTSPKAQGRTYIYSKEWTDEPATYLKTIHIPYPGASANEMIGYHTNTNLSDQYIHSTQSIKMTYVDLQRHKSVYIHAPGLGESSMMTLQGATDVIRRVLLGGATQGDVVTDVLQTGLHSISFTSDEQLKRMRFQVKGYNGHFIAMGNHEIVFELVIQRPGEK